MSILDKLYTHSKHEAVTDILHTYYKKGHCIVTFLYFASLMHYRLLEKQTSDLQRDYLKFLKNSDYLLPDGIALQLFYRWTHKAKHSLHNLNGTDFTPYFLEHLDRSNTQVILYGGLPEYEQNKLAYFKEQGWNILHSQNGYEEFDRSKLDKLKDDGSIRLLLVSRGSPLQELWGNQNEKLIHKHNLLVLFLGGYFDYISGFEKRAPHWVVKARVLETPRRMMAKPSKNVKKFLRMFGIVRYRAKQILSGK